MREQWRFSQPDESRPVLFAVNEDSDGWVVKQPRSLSPEALSFLDREAAIHDVLNAPGWNGLTPLLSPRRCYDRGMHALVQDYVPHPSAITSLCEGVDVATLGRRIGQGLKVVHRPLPAGASSALWPTVTPWPISPLEAHPDEERLPSVAHVLEILRQDASLSGRLTALNELYQPTVLIHGDAKLDNILFDPSTASVRFIDWAYSGRGDPAWDVAMALHGALLPWLSGLRPGETNSAPVVPLSRVRTFARGLLQGYCGPRPPSARFTGKVLQFSAAALVQSAISIARREKRVTDQQLVIMQSASGILADVEEARRMVCI